MYHQISDFLTDWEYESEATLKLLKNLTDESLTTQIHPNVRTLGLMSWHIIHTMQEMLARTGLNVDIKVQQNYSGETVSELWNIYLNGALSVAEVIKNSWNDSDLFKQDEMYGEMWKRGQTLTTLVKHQSHHRGEMIVIMRVLGLPVVGVYGPSKEEWAQWGLEAMK